MEDSCFWISCNRSQERVYLVRRDWWIQSSMLVTAWSRRSEETQWTPCLRWECGNGILHTDELCSPWIQTQVTSLSFPWLPERRLLEWNQLDASCVCARIWNACALSRNWETGSLSCSMDTGIFLLLEKIKLPVTKLLLIHIYFKLRTKDVPYWKTKII